MVSAHDGPLLPWHQRKRPIFTCLAPLTPIAFTIIFRCCDPGDIMPILLLLALLAEPDLSDLNRFPPMPLVEAQIGFLIDQRCFLRGQLAIDPRNANRWQQLLLANDHALRCWETLLEARGGLAEEEGGRDDEEFCREALGRLRALLGERDWFAGMMP